MIVCSGCSLGLPNSVSPGAMSPTAMSPAAPSRGDHSDGSGAGDDGARHSCHHTGVDGGQRHHQHEGEDQEFHVEFVVDATGNV